jgi:hypothetical protein
MHDQPNLFADPLVSMQADRLPIVEIDGVPRTHFLADIVMGFPG